ncbi:MAG: tRNA (guanosine(37)-N1)-methyltransferase TrmD [Candidatus Nealsonbacteria bacterium CG03_land_8_20_14_0_80_36_12]|uniref:tRNA (guanine-N(1)-)-methyltransferase n=1 Tax=Candidatus Nealsonbacteria bacterium CG03_land_8_20_14_0_80_36_12 TaxID=1974701 RepID=A0A2M7BYI2_9BACT|nr:MAG: tRNA (guanosine(37)-N1)-methyltransferase TrmD [Candidatus Nealsonbacteria bacterium CG03_land_8_20_14_0_80_36_12]
MLTFHIITIFPGIFDSYLKESIIKRALKKRYIKVKTHNLRDFTKDKHKTVDDRPFGGGMGMVMKVEPIFKAVQSLTSKTKGQRSKVILFTPRGKKFNQKMAYRFSKLEQLILICGRYEGVDQRVAKHVADMEVSIGDYDLMGGELAAMIVIETTARLIPGVLGKPELLKERITKKKGFIEYPQYTRPPKFYPKGKFRRARPEVWKVPKVLVSGNHKKIEEWRKKHRKIIE